MYTLLPVIVSGENVGLILGPYNTKYFGLKQQLLTVPFLYNAESKGCWNTFLDLDSDKGIAAAQLSYTRFISCALYPTALVPKC